MNITVYCSASTYATIQMHSDAATIGQWIGRNGHTLIYGGIPLGLMKTVADNALSTGAKTIGIVPESRRSAASAADTQTIFAQNLNHRKQLLSDSADLFIALPGGYGTLDEIVSTLATNTFHNRPRPIIILNTDGLFTPLRQQFDKMAAAKLLDPALLSNLLFVPDITQTITLLNKIIP